MNNLTKLLPLLLLCSYATCAFGQIFNDENIIVRYGNVYEYTVDGELVQTIPMSQPSFECPNYYNGHCYDYSICGAGSTALLGYSYATNIYQSSLLGVRKLSTNNVWLEQPYSQQELADGPTYLSCMSNGAAFFLDPYDKSVNVAFVRRRSNGALFTLNDPDALLLDVGINKHLYVLSAPHGKGTYATSLTVKEYSTGGVLLRTISINKNALPQPAKIQVLNSVIKVAANDENIFLGYGTFTRSTSGSYHTGHIVKLNYDGQVVDTLTVPRKAVKDLQLRADGTLIFTTFSYTFPTFYMGVSDVALSTPNLYNFPEDPAGAIAQLDFVDTWYDPNTQYPHAF